MNNATALVLALLLIAAVLGDQLLNGGAATLFLGRKALRLIEWVAVWR